MSLSSEELTLHTSASHASSRSPPCLPTTPACLPTTQLLASQQHSLLECRMTCTVRHKRTSSLKRVRRLLVPNRAYHRRCRTSLASHGTVRHERTRSYPLCGRPCTSREGQHGRLGTAVGEELLRSANASWGNFCEARCRSRVGGNIRDVQAVSSLFQQVVTRRGGDSM